MPLLSWNVIEMMTEGGLLQVLLGFTAELKSSPNGKSLVKVNLSDHEALKMQQCHLVKVCGNLPTSPPLATKVAMTVLLLFLYFHDSDF